MSNFIATIGQVIPSTIKHIRFGTFIFFGASSRMGELFILFFVPETKGVTLEEMEEVFGGSTGLAKEDHQRLEAIQARLGLTPAGADEKDSVEKA